MSVSHSLSDGDIGGVGDRDLRPLAGDWDLLLGGGGVLLGGDRENDLLLLYGEILLLL